MVENTYKLEVELQFEKDTQDHVKKVRGNLNQIIHELIDRGQAHDDTKFQSPERELFIEYTPKLKNCTYGSDEYKGYLKELKVALEHHYGKYPHHPEHYKNGLNDMTLIDIMEMFCDWKASSERHNDGNIHKSIEKNKDRFGMTDQLCKIFENTAKWFEK